VTPPVVGSVRTTTKGSWAAFSSWIARVVRAICIRLRAPSCIRAPPAAVKQTSGTLRATAARAAAMKASPAAMPSEPPMKVKSWTMATASVPSIWPKPMAMVSLRPAALRAAFRRSL
jgi:hypothetical protein